VRLTKKVVDLICQGFNVAEKELVMLFQLNVLSCELLYLSPPLRRIDLFQFSSLIVIVMIFSSFNTSLHLISPKSISH